MPGVVTVIVSAAIGAVVAYLGSIWQTRLEARRVIHERIHEARAKLYPAAWKVTGAFPRRPRTESHTHDSLHAAAVALRDWYYEKGGMYLSGGARRAYTDWQDTVDEVLHAENVGNRIGDDQYETVRRAGSDFRTALTRDLLSRSRAPMSPKRQPHP